MVQRVVSRINKMSVLIVVFIILDFFVIIFSNMLIDGKNFVINEGEYNYDELFYSQNSNKDYYIFSRGYYEDDFDNKYVSGDNVLKKLKFTAVNEFKAMTILSFVARKTILGYCELSNANMVDEELQEVYESEDFVYLGYVYEVLGKNYFYVFFKDYIYTEDSTWSDEDNFYLATKSHNSNSVALFEIDGLDLSVVKQGNEQKTLYRNPFLDIFDIPYRYIFITVCLVEIAVLLIIKKDNTGDGTVCSDEE